MMQKIAKAVGDWFHEKTPFHNKIDCPYPCNPTCPSNKDLVKEL